MLRPWQLEVEINRKSTVSIHLQIANKIIDEIKLGRFPSGMALPGTRALANKLEINRKTVVQAYEELIAQGWLTSESKRGTFVSTSFLSVNSAKKAPNTLDYEMHQALRDKPSLANQKTEHEHINFSSSLSDTRLIPLEILSRAMRHALITLTRGNKQSYLEPSGATILKEALLHMLNFDRGLHSKLNNICVVRGTQMGIFITARVIIKKGDHVVIADFSDQLIGEAFLNCGAKLHYVDQDENGINLNALEAICQSQSIRAIYVTPHYQVPTTVSIPIQHRVHLLALAEQYNFLIIEDDHDFEFNFSSKPIPPLASLDKASRVIYIGSFSKILAPGFRIGFIAAPSEIIEHIVSEIMLIDRQGNIVTELAIAELLHTGEINRQSLKVSKIYDERRKIVIDLLNKELTDYIQFNVPDGGLSLWLTVHPKINMDILIKDCLDQKVRIVNGSEFHHKNKQISAISFGFASLNHKEITTGIKRLKMAFNLQAKALGQPRH
jgi:GntR family transcriptional regulator / MocR family aminotransferase